MQRIFQISWMILMMKIGCTHNLKQSQVLFQSGLICLQIHQPERANAFFYQSAQGKFAPAMKALGDSYWSGDGIGCNSTQAIIWYVHSADQGYGPAQLTLGFILSRGEGGIRNVSLALHYFDLARANLSLEKALREIASHEIKKNRKFLIE
jgi:TPR repeat protein